MTQGVPPATPFNTLLIANRGEVAVRIMRTARAMGYGTVAVYSAADRGAPHVDAADKAAFIGAAPPAQSYLNIASIIAAARATGADAVHPGYGFLAENAAFAQACREAGLVFVGPSAHAIEAMGNKAGAKRLMQAAGVPCIPGYQEPDQTEARLLRAAEDIGFPVMIKATSGGGGRGMRLVAAPGDFLAALRSAQSEAVNAFGSAEVILERAIIEPRHIEIQILADRHGTVLHFGERDCSVQRRHQKLIEEAPSPAVDAALRARMGETSVQAARAIGYEGAGTLEFLLDASGEFYFMEMNTRLQVEHPVTEAVTGIDFVEQQLRIAAGEALLLRQEMIALSGHAIEVRLCAEDPAQSFAPQSGTIRAWRAAPFARVEHALRDGAVIPPDYDSMIAKIIASGKDRAEAIRKLRRAVQETRALGVPTNQAFLIQCLSHPIFQSGDATTGFVAAHGEALVAARRDAAPRVKAIAVALVFSHEDAGAGNDGGIGGLAQHVLILRVGAERLTATLRDLGDGEWKISLGGEEFTVRDWIFRDGAIRVTCNGVTESAWAIAAEGGYFLHHDGAAYRVADESRLPPAREAEGQADRAVRARAAGTIVAVHAAVGDRLRKGDPLITVEAMKMQLHYAAPMDGRLAVVRAVVGSHVRAGEVVAQIEDDAYSTVQELGHE